MKQLIEVIEQYRVLKGISKEQLCAHVGISKTMYWRYINNKSILCVDKLVLMAEALNMQITLSAKTCD